MLIPKVFAIFDRTLSVRLRSSIVKSNFSPSILIDVVSIGIGTALARNNCS